jgi:outer membrane murein-binding lipoprotein Lpp
MASNKFNVALLGSVTAAAMMAAGPVLADEVSDLRAQIEALSQKVQQIETQKAQPAVIPANVVTGGDFPGSYKLPGSNTSWKFGGYVKIDAIYDFDQKAGDQSGGIVEDSDDGAVETDQDTGHFQMSMRQTRFSWDARTATEDLGTVRAYMEMDFNDSDSASESYSNSHNPRLRQAYVSFGPWKFGQAWSSSINLGSFPETIDFGGAVGGQLVRNTEIAYSTKFGGNSLTMAIANPEGRFSGGGTTTGEKDPYPDVIARISRGGKWGHVSFAGTLEFINVDAGSNGGGTDDQVLAHTWTASGRLNTMGKDNIKVSVTASDGSQRYSSLEAVNSGAGNLYNTTTDKLETVKTVGGYIAYQHHWSSKYRSNLVLGGFKANNPGLAAGTAGENSSSVHFNTLYNATSKTNIGLEYQYKTSTNEQGDTGALSRVQFMVQHSF